MEFVEQNGRHAIKQRIGEDHAREHTLGHDLDARAFRDKTRQPHAQADCFADLLAQGRGHAGGGGTSGKTTRLEQYEAFAVGPRLVEERQRRARRLAGARRRNEHSARMAGERCAKRAEHIVDRQRRGVGHPRFLRSLGR